MGEWHQLVLIWVHDAARFEEYLAVMAPIVGRYGGALDRSYTPTAIQAEGLTVPDVINLVHYDSRAGFNAFLDDPDFLRIKHLRDESVTLLSVEGRLTLANPAPPDPRRGYGIDIIRAPEDHRSAGDEVEYLLDVETSSSVDRAPRLARISSLPKAERRKEFQADPMDIRVDATLRAVG
jgi:uncharacterized protein (DUF1330 family)